jgi:hypothetical protein
VRAQLDGDAVMITADDFVNLHESPAAFVDADSELGRKLLELAERDGTEIDRLREREATLNRIEAATWDPLMDADDVAQMVFDIARGRS